MLRRTGLTHFTSPTLIKFSLLRRGNATNFSSKSCFSSSSPSTTSLVYSSFRGVQEVYSNQEMNASRRDQEAFLSQYNPMEELGLYEGVCDIKQIVKAYEEKKKTFKGDKVMIERIERAFNVVTDPKSPYFERLTWQQGYRQRLMIELLPKDQRRAAKGYAYFWGTIGAIAILFFIYSFIHPIKKIWRAATR